MADCAPCGCEPTCKIVPSEIKVGIIGGSGLDDPDILEQRVEKIVETPFGKPSDVIIEGEIHGVKCYLLARHGRNHELSPSNVNYRANIWALRELGCTHILVSNACGSLREEIGPGQLVIPHDIIDRTDGRPRSFYNNSENGPRGVLHIPMCPAFCNNLRQVLINAAKELEIPVHKKGVFVVVEGPRYSTQAESNMFRILGGDIIGMTTMPEAVLAKEAGILYASLALATDYDVWRDVGDKVCTEEVTRTFQANVNKVKEILLLAVKKIKEQDWTIECMEAKHLILDNFLSKSKPNNLFS